MDAKSREERRGLCPSTPQGDDPQDLIPEPLQRRRVWGLGPQRVQGRALAFLLLSPAPASAFSVVARQGGGPEERVDEFAIGESDEEGEDEAEVEG